MNPRNPAMAAVLAASLGLLAPRALFAADTTPLTARETQDCPPSPAERIPANVLAAAIHCGGAEGAPRKDIGDRLVLFVFSTDAQGPLFVTNELLGKYTAEQRALTAVSANATDPYFAAIRQWAKDAAPAKLAELYLVMGDAVKPAWVAGDARMNAAIKAATEESGDFRSRLKTALVQRFRTGTQGRIPFQGKQIDQTRDLLNQAATDAHGILADSRLQSSIRSSIMSNEDPNVVSAGPGGPRVPMPISPRSQFTYEDMYLRGGVAGLVSGPKDPVSAPYTLKLETSRDPGTGEMKTFVAIYDTSENPAFVRRVPMTARGDNPVQHAPGRWNLVLNIANAENGDLAISLHRPGDNESREGLVTSASALARARLQQAIDKAQLPNGGQRVATIGGRQYYVSRQGGTVESALFFPVDLASKPDATWLDLRPLAAAVISRVSGDGAFVPVKGKPDLGEIDGKPYHLELENGAWVVKDGQGDPLQPRNSEQQGSPSGTMTPGVAATEGGYIVDPAANAGLDEETKGKYSIRSKDGGKTYLVLTPANFIPGGQREYFGVTNLRGIGHYIVYEMNGIAVYQDLLIVTDQKTTAGTDIRDFAIVAQVSDLGTEKCRLESITDQKAPEPRWLGDTVVLADALKNFLKFSDANVAKALGNAARVLTGGRKHFIMKAVASGVTIAIHPDGGRGINIYPELQSSPDGPNPQTADGATGTVLDAASMSWSAGNEAFRSSVNLPDSKVMRLQKLGPGGANADNATAALYKTEGAEEWYLYVKFREANSPSSDAGEPSLAKSEKMPVFVRFEAPGLEKISLEGSSTDTGITVQKGARLLRVDGSTSAKGAYILLRSAAGAVKDNCVGPVLWWGLAKDQAKAIGCNGRSIN